MGLSWYSQTTGDAFKADRLYRFQFKSSIAASVLLEMELKRHGRVLYVGQNQPGSTLAQTVTWFWWLPTPTVVSRGDRLGVLMQTLATRCQGAQSVGMHAAQVTPGARENMWDEAFSHPSAQISIAALEDLAQPTVAERAAASAAGTEARARELANTVGAGASTVANAIGGAASNAANSLGNAAENTALYFKVLVALIGGGALYIIAKGGKL